MKIWRSNILQKSIALICIIIMISGCVKTIKEDTSMTKTKEEFLIFEKWKKSVIHLECATDSEHFYDRMKRITSLQEQLKRGEISHEKFAQELTGRSRDIRYHGTSIFVKHESNRYLLTARHVIFDEISAKREFQEEAKRAEKWPEHMRPDLIQSATQSALARIFNTIFRVPSLDEIISSDSAMQREFLMNLGAGGPMAYTFSSPEIDIAVISLDQRDSKFADQLIRLGYEPIDSELISEQSPVEGSDVFTVGYPSSTALIGQITQHQSITHWSSDYFSLPIFAFGKVSMMHNKLPFFWTDMSIYPGNSGGPVIQEGKLVGIVSAQATLPIDGVPDIRTRIPFGKIIKSNYILELLKLQVEKDIQFAKKKA